MLVHALGIAGVIGTGGRPPHDGFRLLPRPPKKGSRSARLFLNGRPTPLTMTLSDDRLPTLSVRRVAGKLTYGAASLVSDGAITVVTDIGFVQDGGRFFIRRGAAPVGRFGRRVLFLELQESYREEPRYAGVYDRGRWQGVGPANEARFAPDGAVVGWYRALGSGVPAPYFGDGPSEPVHRQGFRWKDGRRQTTPP